MEPIPRSISILFNHLPSLISLLRPCLLLFFTYQDLGQVLIGKVGELRAVELGDDELCILLVSFAVENAGMKRDGSRNHCDH